VLILDTEASRIFIVVILDCTMFLRSAYHRVERGMKMTGKCNEN